MSNSSQVDKQPGVQRPGAHQPGDQQQCSHGPGAATDLEQLQTWSSHGPGAATDMEQLQSRTFKEGR